MYVYRCTSTCLFHTGYVIIKWLFISLYSSGISNRILLFMYTCEGGWGVEVRGEGWGARAAESSRVARGRDTRRERRVASERETRGERAPRNSERERERAHTRVQPGGVCLLYRGTRMIWKGRGSRVTSCHSAVPSTYPPPVYEVSTDRWGQRIEGQQIANTTTNNEQEITINE